MGMKGMKNTYDFSLNHTFCHTRTQPKNDNQVFRF